MKTLRKNGGFTLVELIVVIAILAILAGVAVPAYSGYITKAKDAKVVTELDAIKTACIAEGAEKTPYVDVKYIDVSCDAKGKVTTIKYDATTTTNPTYTSELKYTSKGNDWSGTSYVNGATWDGTTWSAKK